MRGDRRKGLDGFAIALATAALLATHPARPCGLVGAREERRPTLAHEQVVLFHDPVKEQEHFIRSVAFRAGDRPFGFVIPTPSRPSVAPVAKSPFGMLRASFAFDPPAPVDSSPGGGFGSGRGRLGGNGLQVLEVMQVGSFTAFILRATDTKALERWLSDNRFATTPELDAWLGHYVALGYFYVALRYNPSSSAAKAAAAVGHSQYFRSETIRISFKTPLPYYPYLEPASSEPVPSKNRLMDLWVVSPSAVVPAAAQEAGPRRNWVQPMRAGQVFERGRHRLVEVLDDELEKQLPAGELVVQTFQDQKTSRAGLGDVFFVPQDRAARRAAIARYPALVASLDPDAALMVIDRDSGRDWAPALRDKLAPVALPVRIGAVSVDGGASVEPVSTALRHRIGAFRSCYLHASSKPGLEGSLRLAFDVAPDGTVKSARALPDSTLRDDAVRSCVIRYLSAIRLSLQGQSGDVHVTATLDFAPRTVALDDAEP